MEIYSFESFWEIYSAVLFFLQIERIPSALKTLFILLYYFFQKYI